MKLTRRIARDCDLCSLFFFFLLLVMVHQHHQQQHSLPTINGLNDVPDGDVEDVGSDGGRHGHVAEALPGHDDAGDQVGDGGAGGQESQAHHLREENGVSRGMEAKVPPTAAGAMFSARHHKEV